MEKIMPLEEWKKMNKNDRNRFLDQFYSFQEKCSYEKEGRETCAMEELDLFQCQKSPIIYKSLQQIFNPCGVLKLKFERCQEVMTMNIKCRKVFGTEFRKYLRIVDEETK